MAAVAKKSKVAPKAKAASKTTSSAPKGLQLSAAYFKQYNASYNAAANAKRTSIAISNAATRFRGGRLQSYHKTVAKYDAKRRMANRAAVAAYATRQSYRQSQLAHQNANLKSRVHADMQRHVTILGRLQYAQAGEKAYVRKALQNTVTQGQAVSFEKKRFAQAAKIAKKVTGKPKGKAKNPFTAKQKAAVKAAGTAAAAKVPKSYVKRTAANPVLTRRRIPASRHWHGNPRKPNCVPTALLNAMQYQGGYRPRGIRGWVLTRRLDRACKGGVTIERGLEILSILLRDGDHRVQLAAFLQVPPFCKLSGHVIGYQSAYGPHAALSITGRRVISWGRELDFEGVPEEAWHLTWRTA